jgi:DnaJ-class molecular chaperone
MNKSKLFFHPDKRKHNQQTSKEEQAAQFAQAKEAWACLSACRSRFQELRTFRDRVQASE